MISKENLVPHMGTNYSRALIFERPDLFEKCPNEVQEYLVLHHAAEVAKADQDFEKARQLLEEASNLLKGGGGNDKV